MGLFKRKKKLRYNLIRNLSDKLYRNLKNKRKGFGTRSASIETVPASSVSKRTGR